MSCYFFLRGAVGLCLGFMGLTPFVHMPTDITSQVIKVEIRVRGQILEQRQGSDMKGYGSPLRNWCKSIQCHLMCGSTCVCYLEW